MIHILLAMTLSLTTFAGEDGNKEAWPGYSAPSIVSEEFEVNFSKLPLNGMNETKGSGWSEDYWASNRGSINRRWNSPSQQGFKLKSPTKTEALKMSQVELERLAPTEKYDLWLGRYNYPLVREVDGNANPNATDWAGICNGWAPASINLQEPKPVTLKNPDGIMVPFGASDIKALLSYYYAYYVEQATHQVGLRCFIRGRFSGLSRACGKDVNPGAMHVILANQMGLLKKGFIADIDQYKEVWNQPIMGFESKIIQDNLAPSSSAANGTVKEILVETNLNYTDETDPQWEPVLGTEAQKASHLKLKYTLEISREGNILGGEWESFVRPDFLWFRDKAPFKAPFLELETLYNQATMEK